MFEPGMQSYRMIKKGTTVSFFMEGQIKLLLKSRSIVFWSIFIPEIFGSQNEINELPYIMGQAHKKK